MPKKKDEVEETVENATEEVAEVEVTEKKPTNEKVSIKASFKTRDTDGNKIIIHFVGMGASFQEAVDDLSSDDMEGPYPAGLNALVNVKVKRGDREFERALAPHRARQILEDKNVVLFNTYFK